MSKSGAIAELIASVQAGKPRFYFLGLVGYYIEGRPCAADGLSVDGASTPNLRRTVEGFSCDAFFPPGLLPPDIVAANGITVSKELSKG
jgi:hypothetical protein